MATGSWDGTVRLWDPETGNSTLTLDAKPGVFSLGFSPGGKHLAAALADQTIRIWDLGDPNKDPLILRGHSEAIAALAWSPDGKRIASASADDTLRIWDTITGQEALSLRGHSSRVVAVAWSPNGKQIATASHDRTINIWDASRAH